MSRTKRPQHAGVPLAGIIAGALLLGLAALALFIKFNAPSAESVNGQPALKVNQEEVDLGDVKLGDYVEASFELTNTGDAPLKFSEEPYIEVVAGC